MAKNPLNVQNFLESLTRRLHSKGHEELQILNELKRKDSGDERAEIKSWDVSFYNNLLKEQNYSVNEETIREYFPSDHVVKTTMEIYQELLGLKFSKVERDSLWHEEATCYEVHDDNNEFLGTFYLDLYPREGKYGHAAVFPLEKRAEVEGKVHKASVAMLCNFDKPTESKPSLLIHSDVVTFFHEFGHVMHGLCSHAKYARFSGTSVERDFVELPS